MRSAWIAPYRSDLLDLAFDAASTFPLDPHIKNRSRAQELVVRTCFELDQPEKALRYVKQIDNWRRGVGYADYAYYMVVHGYGAEVQGYLDRALQVARESAHAKDSQAWRVSRIRSRVARVYILLGQRTEAERVGAMVVDSEIGAIELEMAKSYDGKAFDKLIENFDEVLSQGSLDRVRNTLRACSLLFDRFYGDEMRRRKMEDRVRNSYEKLPLQLRIDLLINLAGIAIRKKDQVKALELIDEAWKHLTSTNWLPQDQIPIVCRIASARFQAGQATRARQDVDSVLRMFRARRSRIVDIYRAGLLRRIAETYHEMGDTHDALEIYKRAAEEGIINPNSRPRCDDLVATCCSLASGDVEPDADLRTLLMRTRRELGNPW